MKQEFAGRETRPAALQELPFLVGRSEALGRIGKLIRHVAPTNTTVLITGESGCGKELIARAIHALSPRHDRVFLPINCAAIPETLLEAQLFGHVRGAYTGADASTAGFFQQADGGTLLLDEVGELPFHLQPKLLRVIEGKEVIPLGAPSPVPVHARLIASTNRDLRAAVANGRFREDLFYRLNVVRIHVPPLRERRDDIPELVDHVIRQQNVELCRAYRGVTSATLEILLSSPWRGNVRELRHAIEYAMIIGDGEWIRPENLPPDLLPTSSAESFEASESLSEALQRFEKAYLSNVLREGTNRRDVATRLGIDPSTLYRKLQALGIKS